MSTPLVLIAGAGPAGLTLAIELARRGVAARLVDAAAGPATTSRAFTLHARTLEAFDAMGVPVDGAPARTATAMHYHFVDDAGGAAGSVRLPFEGVAAGGLLRGRHPHIVTLPQSETEGLLRRRLAAVGGAVEWGTRVGAFDEGPAGVTVSLHRTAAAAAAPGGGAAPDAAAADESVTVPYLVACDGAHSAVRRGLGVAFAGTKFAGISMTMMDVRLSPTVAAHYPADEYTYVVHRSRMLLLAKMGDDAYGGTPHVWRVLMSAAEAEPDASVAAFQAGADALTGLGAGRLVMDAPPLWTSVYGVHRRMADAYTSAGGRVLLAGDAAHINSPAGGQGMNVCIQDAFNLGWRLALALVSPPPPRGAATHPALATYEAERRPVAAAVGAGSSALHHILMAHGAGVGGRLAAAQASAWVATAVRAMSGQAFSYAAVGGSDGGGAGGDGGGGGAGNDDDGRAAGENGAAAAVAAAVAAADGGGAAPRLRRGDHAPDVVVSPAAAPPSAAPVWLSALVAAGGAPYFVVVTFGGGAAGDGVETTSAATTAAAAAADAAAAAAAAASAEAGIPRLFVAAAAAAAAGRGGPPPADAAAAAADADAAAAPVDAAALVVRPDGYVARVVGRGDRLPPALAAVAAEWLGAA